MSIPGIPDILYLKGTATPAKCGCVIECDVIENEKLHISIKACSVHNSAEALFEAVEYAYLIFEGITDCVCHVISSPPCLRCLALGKLKSAIDLVKS